MALLMSFLGAIMSYSQIPSTPREQTWSTNGNVRAIAQVNQKVYLGGDFDYVGPYIGSSALLDTSRGFPISSFPKINGTVLAAIPDGNNGWYIGGQFSQVGDLPCNNLAHVLGNNLIDVSWNPNPDGNVLVLSVNASWIYVGGNFNDIGGAAQKYIACIGVTTGLPKTNWNPSINGSVNSISISGTKVYLGGTFDTANGQRRNHLACLDVNTGSTTSWNPNPMILSLPTASSNPNLPITSLQSANSVISAVSVYGSTVYIGGIFDSVGGQARKNIAAVDTATGAATSWSPNANDKISCLCLNGSNMYVGGNFTTINNQARNFLACFDLTTGSLTNWNPNANWYVFAISIRRNKVYAGGYFKIIGGQKRSNIARLDATSGLADNWDPNAVGTSAGVFTLSAQGAFVYAGGSFSYIGGKTRSHLACIDAVSGTATDWNPNVAAKYYSASVYALSVNGPFLYVGGAFDSIDGQARKNIACLDTSSGLPTDWNPTANKSVKTIYPNGTFVYVGGEFDTIGGQPRKLLACLDSTIGTATSWNPSPTYSKSQCWVFSLCVAGSDVYVGGIFDSVGGKSRYCLASLDAITGLPTNWDPNPNGQIQAISVNGNSVYVGGIFATIGDTVQYSLACLDRNTGHAINWHPYLGPGNSVYAMCQIGNKIYEGGDYQAATIDATTGVITWCDPQPDGFVTAMASSESCIFMGGSFLNIAGKNHPYFCQFGDYVVPVRPFQDKPSKFFSKSFDISVQKLSGNQTSLEYSLAHDAYVTIQIFDMRGRLLFSVANGKKPAGDYRLLWPFKCRMSGLYLLRFQADYKDKSQIVSITR
jgi:hypothetical protein